MARECTNRILELVEEGVLSAESVLKACLVYMSEHDVEDMARFNGIELFPDEDEEE